MYEQVPQHQSKALDSSSGSEYFTHGTLAPYSADDTYYAENSNSAIQHMYICPGYTLRFVLIL